MGVRVAMSLPKVVVFGGTFDPVHNGHIAIARCLRDELDAEVVLMVPTGRPWLRNSGPVALAADRLQMVELALKSEWGIEVSDVDIVRDKTTYSIDTINDLRSRYGADREFILAIGADSVANLHRWHRYDELTEECTLAVIERPGSPLGKTVALPPGALVIRGPMVDVSASRIRTMIGSGEAAKAANVLPRSVLRFIIEKGLYR